MNPVDEYLRQLHASLRTRDADRIVAEAEDHLRETVAAGLAAGLTEHEAQEAAISAFGSVRAVVRAHAARPGHLFRGRSPGAIVADFVMAGWQLGATGLLSIGASGVVVALMNITLGRSFTGQPRPGVTFPKASCDYWLAAWRSARTCAQAAMLEASSDAVTLRVFAGLAGAGLLAGYVVVRDLHRRRAGEGPVLAGYYPVLAAGTFGAGALTLALAQLSGFNVTWGPGNYLSGGLVAAALAVWYGVRARPVIRNLTRVWARHARAR